MVATGRLWPISDLGYRAPTGSYFVGQLNLGLFGYLERIVNIKPEVADGTFELGVAE